MLEFPTLFLSFPVRETYFLSPYTGTRRRMARERSSITRFPFYDFYEEFRSSQMVYWMLCIFFSIIFFYYSELYLTNRRTRRDGTYLFKELSEGLSEMFKTKHKSRNLREPTSLASCVTFNPELHPRPSLQPPNHPTPSQCPQHSRRP